MSLNNRLKKLSETIIDVCTSEEVLNSLSNIYSRLSRQFKSIFEIMLKGITCPTALMINDLSIKKIEKGFTIN